MNEKQLDYHGTIVSISPEQKITEKFSKRVFVMSDKSAQYPQLIEFEFNNDKCRKLDNYAVGSMVEVSFNLRGRQWTDAQGVVKTFNTLQAWRIALFNVDTGKVAENQNAQGSVTAEDKKPDDNLPF